MTEIKIGKYMLMVKESLGFFNGKTYAYELTKGGKFVISYPYVFHSKEGAIAHAKTIIRNSQV